MNATTKLYVRHYFVRFGDLVMAVELFTKLYENNIITIRSYYTSSKFYQCQIYTYMTPQAQAFGVPFGFGFGSGETGFRFSDLRIETRFGLFDFSVRYRFGTLRDRFGSEEDYKIRVNPKYKWVRFFNPCHIFQNSIHGLRSTSVINQNLDIIPRAVWKVSIRTKSGD